MNTTDQQIFCGTFSDDGDDFLLQDDRVLGGWVQISVQWQNFPSNADSQRINLLAAGRQQVSILGRLGNPTLTEIGTIPSVLGENIASHQDIAQRAYEIYGSGGGGSTLDNWLLAERQVLGI
jgi:hypothetical protein